MSSLLRQKMAGQPFIAAIRTTAGLQDTTLFTCRSLSTATSREEEDDYWSQNRVTSYSGHNFPDFIEHWNRDNFKRVGYVLGGSTGLLAAGSAVSLATASTTSTLLVAPTVVLAALTAAYWRIGLRDMKQTSHAIRRNYPVLGNLRYIFETVRC